MEINWALIFSFRCIKYCRDYHHYRIKRHVVSVSSVECRPGGRLCERTYTRYTWCSAKFISFFSSSANTCERASERARTTNVWIVHSTSQRSDYSNHIKEMPNCCHSIAFRVFSSHHFMIFIFLRSELFFQWNLLSGSVCCFCQLCIMKVDSLALTGWPLTFETQKRHRATIYTTGRECNVLWIARRTSTVSPLVRSTDHHTYQMEK